MKIHSLFRVLPTALFLLLALSLVACNSDKADPKAEAPPKAVVEPDLDANNFKVDHPEQFPLATSGRAQSGSGSECDWSRATRHFARRARNFPGCRASCGD